MQTDSTDLFNDGEDLLRELHTQPGHDDIQKEGMKVVWDDIKRSEDEADRLPPRTFKSDKLPSEHSWHYSDNHSNQRWKTIPEKKERVLLSEELESCWRSVLNDKESPLLLVGPTGVGKDALAALIHYLGPRRKCRFRKIGARELSSELMVSRFHGYQEDSHSMAHKEEPGLFKEADGGTLVLDDIDLSSDVQQMMLTFMDDKLAKPDGPKAIEYRVDVRLIATTNRDPDDASVLRQDLRYRFGNPLLIPSLAERNPVDVAMLLQEYLKESENLRAITIRTLLSAMSNPWPGNIRQLIDYCRRVSNCASQDGYSSVVLDETASPEMALPSLSVDASGTQPNDVIRWVAKSLLLENIGMKRANRIESGNVKAGNSLLLLAHLAGDLQADDSSFHYPASVPLRRLQEPDSFPPCYEALPDFGDCKQPLEGLNLIEFLAHIVRLVRRNQHMTSIHHSNDELSPGWKQWLRQYPAQLLPDYMAMDTVSNASPRYVISGAGESTDGRTVSTGIPPPQSGYAEMPRMNPRSRCGRPAAITDEHLVEILRWADGDKLAGRFTEPKLWKKFQDEVGSKLYKNHGALSQRVRRIRDPELQKQAKALVKYLFNTMA